MPPEMWSRCAWDALSRDADGERLRQAQRWRDGIIRRRPFLVLNGPPGTGKTHAGVALLADFIRDDRTVRYAVVAELLDAMRASFRATDGPTVEEIVRRERTADVLMLDDLGAEQQTEWAAAQLFQLVNHRYERGMTTIITTNIRSIDAPRDRLWSRIYGEERSWVITTTGPDRRRPS